MYVCILRGIAGQRSNVWKIGLYWIRNLFLDCVSDNKAKRDVYVFHSDIYFYVLAIYERCTVIDLIARHAQLR